MRHPVTLTKEVAVLLVVAQVGPLATPAAADPPAVRRFCPTPGAELREPGADGAVIVWVCTRVLSGTSSEYWEWTFSRIEPARRDRRTIWRGGASSPPYKMTLQAAIGEGRGGGFGLGSVTIFSADYGNLDRRIAARTIVQVQAGPTARWATCHDTGWREARTPRSWMQAFVAQGIEPDCGDGYYRAQVAGRFYSTSRHRWVQRGWIYSGALFMNGPTCCVATSRPAPGQARP
jgi:hypothetical protein